MDSKWIVTEATATAPCGIIFDMHVVGGCGLVAAHIPSCAACSEASERSKELRAAARANVTPIEPKKDEPA